MVTPQARPGKEAGVEGFLKSALPLVEAKNGHNHMVRAQGRPATFGTFDTFQDEAGRTAHVTGEVAKALLARAEELFVAAARSAEKEISCPARPSRPARNAHGKRRIHKMHNLVVSCVVVAYLSANVYAVVKMRVFELARSRMHLLLYGVLFLLWGSVVLLGCKLVEIMRRFEEWAA